MPSCRIAGRRRQAAILTVALLAGPLALPAPAGAVAPVGPQVSILAPTADQTGSGNVAFTVAINQPDSAHPVTQVFLQMFGTAQTRQDKTVDLAAGQCAPSCTISQTFDTSTLVVPQNALSVNTNLADGQIFIAATVYTSFGPYTEVDGTFTLDNHRPTLDLPDLKPDPVTGQYPPLAGDDRLRAVVSASPNASTGASIASLRIMVPSYPVTSLANQSLAAPAGGTGPLDVDLTTVPDGPYVGYLAAIDSSGQASALYKFGLQVRHYQISAAASGVFHSDYGDVIVTPTWVEPAASTWIDSIDAYFDGVLAGHTNGFMHPHTFAGVRLQHPGSPFPVGYHSVRLVVTDNRGITKELTILVQVMDPVTVSWTVHAAASGEPSSVSAHVESATSPISSVTLADERGVFARLSPKVPADPVDVAGTVTEATVGTHQLTATVVQSDGYSYQLHRSLVVVPAATTAAYLASSRAGAAVYINGLVKQELSGTWSRAAHRTVYLQRLLAGRWQTVLARSTDAQGQLAVGFIQARAMSYRLYVGPTALAHAATSATAVR